MKVQCNSGKASYKQPELEVGEPRGAVEGERGGPVTNARAQLTQTSLEASWPDAMSVLLLQYVFT